MKNKEILHGMSLHMMKVDSSCGWNKRSIMLVVSMVLCILFATYLVPLVREIIFCCYMTLTYMYNRTIVGPWPFRQITRPYQIPRRRWRVRKMLYEIRFERPFRGALSRNRSRASLHIADQALWPTIHIGWRYGWPLWLRAIWRIMRTC